MVWRIYMRHSRERGFASTSEFARETEAAQRDEGFEVEETTGVRRRVVKGGTE